MTLTGVGGAVGIAFGLGAAFLARAFFKFQAAAPWWVLVASWSRWRSA